MGKGKGKASSKAAAAAAAAAEAAARDAAILPTAVVDAVVHHMVANSRDLVEHETMQAALACPPEVDARLKVFWAIVLLSIDDSVLLTNVRTIEEKVKNLAKNALFASNLPTSWSQAAVLRAKNLPRNFQLAVIRTACAAKSASLPAIMLLDGPGPYSRVYETIVAEHSVHVIWALCLGYECRDTQVRDKQLVRAHAPIGYTKEEGELLCRQGAVAHVIRIIDVCSKGSVAIAVDRERARQEQLVGVWRTLGLHAKADDELVQKWTASVFNNASVQAITFTVEAIYVSEAERDRQVAVIETIESGHAARAEATNLDLVEKIMSTDAYCRELVSVVEASRGFSLKLSEQEMAVLSLPNNVLLIGRSGTGKTTCAVLRLWAKFQQLRSLGRVGDQEAASKMHAIFVTLSPVLSQQIKKYYWSLGGGDTPVSSSATPTAGLDFPANGPLFASLKEVLVSLDATMEKSFFSGEDAYAFSGTTELDLLDDSWHPSMPDESVELDVNAPPVATLASREVTFEKFEKLFSTPTVHQSVVWTEIFSHIEGSLHALDSPSGFLTRQQYLGLGRKQSTLSQDQRGLIYDTFEKYVTYKRQTGSYDLQDLVSHLYREVKTAGYHGPLIHCVTIDEVQDFPASTLKLLMSVCMLPSGFFCTGDTAQTIARGVGFRFCDLRSIFHERKQLSRVYDYPVPELHQLTVNYRSHRQLHAFSHSLVHVIEQLFPHAIDRLQPDAGTRDGPLPVLADHDRLDDVFGFLFGHHAGGAMQFGARQAVIVRCEEDAANLPEVLKPALCLTIFQAKGLEFDDVVLYNFFGSSEVEDSKWRYAFSCVGEPPVLADVASLVSTTFEDLDSSQASSTFDPTAFGMATCSILCTELKQLYTAVTRARNRLVILDDLSAAPSDVMSGYWSSAGLSTTSLDFVAHGDDVPATTAADWKEQGLVMLSRQFYAQARKCFTYSGDEELRVRAQAFMLAEEAKALAAGAPGVPQPAVDLLLEAAGMFHSIGLIGYAGQCMSLAGKHREAAVCFEGADLFAKAASSYGIAKDWVAAARCARACGDFTAADRYLAHGHLWIERVALAAEAHGREAALVMARRVASKAVTGRLELSGQRRALLAGMIDGGVSQRVAIALDLYQAACGDALSVDDEGVVAALVTVQLFGLALAVLLDNPVAIDISATEDIASGLCLSLMGLAGSDDVLVEAGRQAASAATLLQDLSGFVAQLCYAGLWRPALAVCSSNSALFSEPVLFELGCLPGCGDAALAVLTVDSVFFPRLDVTATRCLAKPSKEALAAFEAAFAASNAFEDERKMVGEAVRAFLGSDPAVIDLATRLLGLSIPADDLLAFSTLVLKFVQRGNGTAAGHAQLLAAHASLLLRIASLAMNGCTDFEDRCLWADGLRAIGCSLAPSVVGGLPSLVVDGAINSVKRADRMLVVSFAGKGSPTCMGLSPCLLSLLEVVTESESQELLLLLLDVVNSLAPLSPSRHNRLKERVVSGPLLESVYSQTATLAVARLHERSEDEELVNACVELARTLALGAPRTGHLAFTLALATGVDIVDFYGGLFSRLESLPAALEQTRAFVALYCGDVVEALDAWLASAADVKQFSRPGWEKETAMYCNNLAEWRMIVLYVAAGLAGAEDSVCEECSVPSSVLATRVPEIAAIAAGMTSSYGDVFNGFASLVADLLTDAMESPKDYYGTELTSLCSLVATLVFNCGISPAEDTNYMEAVGCWLEDARDGSISAVGGAADVDSWDPDSFTDLMAAYADPVATVTEVRCTVDLSDAHKRYQTMWAAIQRGQLGQSLPLTGNSSSAAMASRQAAHDVMQDMGRYMRNGLCSNPRQTLLAFNWAIGMQDQTMGAPPADVAGIRTTLAEFDAKRTAKTSEEVMAEAVREKEVQQRKLIARTKNREKQAYARDKALRMKGKRPQGLQ